MDQLIITGMYRSGTTLLQKLLQSHKKVFVADQPFPNLYLYLKKAFLLNIGVEKSLPLDHLFMENLYTNNTFIDFLDFLRIEDEYINKIFKENLQHPGRRVNEVKSISYHELPSNLPDILSILHSRLAAVFNRSNLSVCGSKEIIIEEYIPYFLKHNIKVILIIRDIRDVLCSLNKPGGKEYMGKSRPTLYNIRNWRKSLAFAMHCKGNPNFLVIKYEDLVNDQEDTLEAISGFLGIEKFSSSLLHHINDEYGHTWKGNSSFDKYDNVNSNSVENYKDMLSEAYTRYLETTCYPELKAFHYNLSIVKDTLDKKTIEEFREPFRIDHPSVDPDYSMDEKHIAKEIKRLALLSKDDVTDAMKRSFFIFEDVYDKLKQA